MPVPPQPSAQCQPAALQVCDPCLRFRLSLWSLPVHALYFGVTGGEQPSQPTSAASSNPSNLVLTRVLSSPTRCSRRCPNSVWMFAAAGLSLGPTTREKSAAAGSSFPPNAVDEAHRLVVCKSCHCPPCMRLYVSMVRRIGFGDTPDMTISDQKAVGGRTRPVSSLWIDHHVGRGCQIYSHSRSTLPSGRVYPTGTMYIYHPLEKHPQGNRVSAKY